MIATLPTARGSRSGPKSHKRRTNDTDIDLWHRFLGPNAPAELRPSPSPTGTRLKTAPFREARDLRSQVSEFTDHGVEAQVQHSTAVQPTLDGGPPSGRRCWARRTVPKPVSQHRRSRRRGGVCLRGATRTKPGPGARLAVVVDAAMGDGSDPGRIRRWMPGDEADAGVVSRTQWGCLRRTRLAKHSARYRIG